MEQKNTKVNSHNYDRSIEGTRFSLYIFYSYTLVIGHGINIMNLAPTSAFFKSNLRFRDIQIKLVKRGKNVGNATWEIRFSNSHSSRHRSRILHFANLEGKRRQRHKKIIRSNATVLEKQLNSRWGTSSSIINHRREQTAIWYSFFFILISSRGASRLSELSDACLALLIVYRVTDLLRTSRDGFIKISRRCQRDVSTNREFRTTCSP